MNDPRTGARSLGLTSTLVLVLGLGLAGCTDSPAGPDGSDFDAQATAQAMSQIASTADEDSDVGVTLDLISDRISDSGAFPSVALLLVSEGLEPYPTSQALELLRGAESDGGAGSDPLLSVLIPDALMGKTLVYNPETGEYEVDPSRTGAPSTGVRFILYAVDPLTREPALPLNEIGHVDLIDETTAETGLRLRVRAVDDTGEAPVTLVDYFVEGSVVISGDSQLTLDAEGFISDGTRRLDFTLSQEISLPAGSSTAQATADYLLSLEGDDLSARLLVEASVNIETEQLVSLSVDLTLENGADIVLFALDVDQEGALTGSVIFRDETVVVIGGTLDEPTFTQPDGSELSEDERQALRDIVDAVEDIIDFAEAILGVFDG